MHATCYGPRAMSSGVSDASGSDGGRLGGARADFVASLGRKVSDTRSLLSVLDDDPSSKPARDELRRRLHALCSGARLLRFEAMAHSLQEALAVLDRAAHLGEMGEPEIAFTAQVIDDLPALAWTDGPSRDGRGAEGAAHAAVHQLPYTVLVVGGPLLADTLSDGVSPRARPFECERTEDIDTALKLARAYAPDLVLVDADLPRASDLVEALLDDPLTEPVPILVVGTFRPQDEVARFTALGVAKCFAKPLSGEKIRTTCEEILDATGERTVRVTLGEPTLEQLAGRLADELKRALVDSVDPPARAFRIPLGEGADVLGALWGAIARVQEIVTQRTDGAIRFGGDAPEGAIALAPWLHHDVAASDRLSSRGRGAAVDVRMTGRRVVVADDDPGVTWFISDLLRTAGCEVFEALDGVTALELAYRTQPELVVSDILMPGLDGFALSRALRRDVAMRDTPVILLSWKEDLLQRVRELGASAAAYMRKETDSRAILARVREVLRPRARIEMRIRAPGEVRGRLDDLSPRLLLDLVCVVRKDARVAVRDATFLYEIDIRGGAPRKATRTTSDGGYQSGERALASLLGVGAGRFVVSSTQEPIRGELTGTLFEQLASPIAWARGALVATTGKEAMNVDRIAFDRGALEDYLRATPDPARSLLTRIAEGASPRQMLLGGDVSPSLLEDVLSDLAARGAIRGVTGVDGADLLTPAVEKCLAIVRGEPHRPSSRVPPNARPSVPLPEPNVPSRRVEPSSPRLAYRAIVADAAPSSPRLAYEALAADAPPVFAREEASKSDPKPEEGAAAKYESVGSDDEEDEHETAREDATPSAENGAAPSSLEDAVMREISDRSPFPGAAHVATPVLPPLVSPAALRPRTSTPPPSEGPGDAPARPMGHVAVKAEIVSFPDVLIADVVALEFTREPTVLVDLPLEPKPVGDVSASARPTAAPKAPKEPRKSRFPWGFLTAFLVLVAAAAAALGYSGTEFATGAAPAAQAPEPPVAAVPPPRPVPPVLAPAPAPSLTPSPALSSPDAASASRSGTDTAAKTSLVRPAATP